VCCYNIIKYKDEVFMSAPIESKYNNPNIYYSYEKEFQNEINKWIEDTEDLTGKVQAKEAELNKLFPNALENLANLVTNDKKSKLENENSVWKNPEIQECWVFTGLFAALIAILIVPLLMLIVPSFMQMSIIGIIIGTIAGSVLFGGLAIVCGSVIFNLIVMVSFFMFKDNFDQVSINDTKTDVYNIISCFLSKELITDMNKLFSETRKTNKLVYSDVNGVRQEILGVNRNDNLAFSRGGCKQYSLLGSSRNDALYDVLAAESREYHKKIEHLKNDTFDQIDELYLPNSKKLQMKDNLNSYLLKQENDAIIHLSKKFHQMKDPLTWESFNQSFSKKEA